MGRIPVFRTVGQTYAFALGGYFTVLAIVWLPVLARIALNWSLMHRFYDHPAGGYADLLLDPHFRLMNFLFECLALVLSAIISVGISKEILGIPRGPRFFYAGFGAAELRVIGGYLALILIFGFFLVAFLFGILILGGIVRGVIAATADADRTNATIVSSLVLVSLVLLFSLALVYSFIRLTFLFLPATVAENRIGILRGWELTAGNFWRIFAIGIFVFLPWIVLILVAGLMVLGRDYVPFVMAHSNDPAAIQTFVMRRMSILFANLPLLLGLNFLLAPLVYGLMLAPASFAYRALTGEQSRDEGALEPALPAWQPQGGKPDPETKSRPEFPKIIEDIIGSDENGKPAG